MSNEPTGGVAVGLNAPLDRTNYRALAAEVLAEPLDLIREVLVKHTAAILEELRAGKHQMTTDERRADDKRERELRSAVAVAVFDFAAHDPEHAKKMLYEEGWIAGAYHARKRSNAI